MSFKLNNLFDNEVKHLFRKPKNYFINGKTDSIYVSSDSFSTKNH